MLKRDRLKKEALVACRWRGHKMGKFTNFTYGAEYRQPRRTAMAFCKVCDAWVNVTDRPLPNEIEIGGEAVALCCAEKRKIGLWAE